MPGKIHIDSPGALYHIIVRGIEGRKIFKDDTGRINFLDRLRTELSETDTKCFAWARRNGCAYRRYIIHYYKTYFDIWKKISSILKTCDISDVGGHYVFRFCQFLSSPGRSR